MAKKNTLPSMDGEGELVASSSTCTAEAVHVMGHTIEPELMTPATVSLIQVPLSPITTTGYVSKRADLKLTRKQCLTLRSVLRGLQDSGAHLENGRPVMNITHAAQWILEQIADQSEKPIFGNS